jgi:uncharacterized PurR-regulated membrane protein YhhQ (DUF165 family)
MNFSISNYFHPTPKKARVFGDSILAVSTFVTSGGLLAFDQLKDIFTPHELKIIIGCAFAGGVIGKYVSNFFKEEENEPKETTT